MNLSSARAIVVGVDGTPVSRGALEFAIREAAASDSVVEVVTVWSWAGAHESLAGPASPQEAHDRAQRIQDSLVTEALAQVEHPPVISRQVVHGEPAQVLLRAARNARYLVVGTSHKGMLTRAFLGSVSEHCVHHSACPVVVVPSAHAAAVDAPLAATGG